LRVPNAALRYTPAGVQRQEFRAERNPALASENESEDAPQFAQKGETPPARLAPGQKWDPSQKIKFSAPKRVVQRPGVVVVLDGQEKPQPKKVLLGITDGSATEVVSGEINPGDAVIIGDSTQTAQTPASPTAPPFFPGFGGRGGGRGRGN